MLYLLHNTFKMMENMRQYVVFTVVELNIVIFLFACNKLMFFVEHSAGPILNNIPTD